MVLPRFISPFIREFPDETGSPKCDPLGHLELVYGTLNASNALDSADCPALIDSLPCLPTPVVAWSYSRDTKDVITRPTVRG